MASGPSPKVFSVPGQPVSLLEAKTPYPRIAYFASLSEAAVRYFPMPPTYPGAAFSVYLQVCEKNWTFGILVYMTGSHLAS